MQVYTVTWITKMRCGTKIEADSAEEALEIARSGQYDDVDSEPTGKDTGFKVVEGETFIGKVTRKKP